MNATLNGHSNSDLRDLTQYHADTIKLYDSLKGATVGDTYQYQQLTKLLGTNIERRRGCLQTAIRLLRRKKNLVFGTIRGIGIKCLDGEEVVSGEATTLRSIRRKARTGAERIGTVDIAKLSPESKTQALVQQASLAAMIHSTSRNTQGRLTEAIKNNAEVTGNVNLVLECFKGA